MNDVSLSPAKSSRWRWVAPRPCTATALATPSSTVAVVTAPASLLARALRRVMPVINSVEMSTMGAARQATTTTEGTALKLWAVVQITVAITNRLATGRTRMS